MIHGPQFNQQIHRVQPVEGDRPDDDQPDERKRRRVLYHGRAWTEAEEELPIQPTQPMTTPSRESKKRASAVAYADEIYVERAATLLRQMTTLEEKAAQLCFFENEAIYDATLQQEVELLIQTWQIGGVLFRRGDYKREAYLVERYQSVSKTALLIANDFLHGLSFYLQGDAFPKGSLSEQRCSDLGKAVMVQNRSLGVHIQFDRERAECDVELNPRQVQAFRRGIRQAQGVVGKGNVESKENTPVKSSSAKGNFPILEQTDLQVQETVGFKTVAFFDATKRGLTLEEELLKAFDSQYDAFLLSSNISEAIRTLCQLVRLGKIREADLDRRIMKILIIKALFFN